MVFVHVAVRKIHTEKWNSLLHKGYKGINILSNVIIDEGCKMDWKESSFLSKQYLFSFVFYCGNQIVFRL